MKFSSPKYTLIKTGFDGNKIEHEFKAETLTELLANIENFIRGSGFYVEGERLDFVSEKDEDLFQFTDLGLNEDTITLTGVGEDQHIDIGLDDITISLDDTYGTTTSFLDEKLK